MADPSAGLATQLANIERTYGKSTDHWMKAISESGLTKHPDIVTMLKNEHGLAHGAAHRLSIVHRDRRSRASQGDPVEALYAGRPLIVRAIHDSLMAYLNTLSDDIEAVPKSGYLSLRRSKQFAMLKPAANRVDLGLILKDITPRGRLEPAGSFNRLFTHRVRVTNPSIDADLARWLRAAHSASA